MESPRERLKVKSRTFIYRRLQGNPVQERFTMRSGELTGNDTGQEDTGGHRRTQEDKKSPKRCDVRDRTKVTKLRTNRKSCTRF